MERRTLLKSTLLAPAALYLTPSMASAGPRKRDFVDILRDLRAMSEEKQGVWQIRPFPFAEGVYSFFLTERPRDNKVPQTLYAYAFHPQLYIDRIESPRAREDFGVLIKHVEGRAALAKAITAGEEETAYADGTLSLYTGV